MLAKVPFQNAVYNYGLLKYLTSLCRSWLKQQILLLFPKQTSSKHQLVLFMHVSSIQVVQTITHLACITPIPEVHTNMEDKLSLQYIVRIGKQSTARSTDILNDLVSQKKKHMFSMLIIPLSVLENWMTKTYAKRVALLSPTIQFFSPKGDPKHILF